LADEDSVISPRRDPSTLLGTLTLWFELPHHLEPVDGSKGREQREFIVFVVNDGK
jgi:hypothetical protein